MREVNRVLDSVADLPREQVPAMLDSLCHSPEVRRKVERALEALAKDATLGGMLETPAFVTKAMSDPDGSVPQRRIGGYELIRIIGEGGMGTVYEARQESPQRSVALKVLRGGFGTAGSIRRFQRESAALGMLHHAGIAQIYEAGVDDTPLGRVPFFAMELVRGEPLDVFVRVHRCAVEDVLRIAARICDAVHHAHTHGVVHRDLKPGNILVEDAPAASPGSGSRFGDGGSGVSDGGPSPKILDFGVARINDLDASISTLHTATGQIVGTPTYMSPEQVSGTFGNIGPRTDVYALGVIIYELLAGRPPLDVRTRSLPEATRIITTEEAPPLRKFAGKIHEDIETIVAKAMDKDPKRRYSSAAEMAMDLRRFLHKEPISARPATTMYQLRRFAARNKTLVGGIAATVIALALGLAGTIIFASRVQEQRGIALAQTKEALKNLYFASVRAAQSGLLSNDSSLARQSLQTAPPSLRGWEWDHISWAVERGRTELAPPSPAAPTRWSLGLGGAVGTGGEVIFVNTDTGESRRLYSRQGRVPNGLTSVSPDGTRALTLATGAGNEVWNLSSGTLISAFGLDSGGFTWLEDRLVSVRTTISFQKEVMDAQTGVVLGRHEAADIALHIEKGELAGWYYLDPQLMRYVKQPAAAPTSSSTVTAHVKTAADVYAVAPSGAWLARYIHEDRALVLERTGSGEVLKRLPREGAVTSISVRPDDSDLALLMPDGRIETWNIASETMLARIAPPPGGTLNTVYTTDGKWLLVYGKDGRLTRYDADVSDSVFSAPVGGGLAFSPDASQVITRAWGPLRCFDARTGQCRWTLVRGHGYTNAAAFTSDGSRVALGYPFQIVLADAATGKVLAQSETLPTRFIFSIVFDRSGKTLYFGCGDGTIWTLSESDGWTHAMQMPVRHNSPVWALALSDDESRLLSGSGNQPRLGDITPSSGTNDNSVRVCDLSRGPTGSAAAGAAPSRILATHAAGVSAIICVGNQVVSAGIDGVLKCTNVSDATQAWSQHVSDNGLTAVSLRTDEKGNCGYLVGDLAGAIHLCDTSGRSVCALSPTGPGGCNLLAQDKAQHAVVGIQGNRLVRFETGETREAAATKRAGKIAASFISNLNRDQVLVEDRLALIPGLIAPEADKRTFTTAVKTFGEASTYLVNSAIFLCLDANVDRSVYVLAERMARRGVEIDPKSQYYRDIWALSLLRLQDHRAALATLEDAERAAPADDQNAFHALLKVIASIKCGDRETAQQLFEKAKMLMQTEDNRGFDPNRVLLDEAKALLSTPK